MEKECLLQVPPHHFKSAPLIPLTPTFIAVMDTKGKNSLVQVVSIAAFLSCVCQGYICGHLKRTSSLGIVWSLELKGLFCRTLAKYFGTILKY